MFDLLNQVERAVQAKAYYLALFASLTIPDICGAMETDDGAAKKSRYIKWFDKYVAPAYTISGKPTFCGTTCYKYRCAMLHQGRAQHEELGFSRILFVEPGATNNVFHNNILNDALNIDVSIFCRDVVDGAKSWLKEAEMTANFQKNYPHFMQRYPNGLAPYIVGVPVIA